MNNLGAISMELLLGLIASAVTTVAWSYSTFLSKDQASILREARTAEIAEIRTDVREIKSDVKDILKVMRHE